MVYPWGNSLIPQGITQVVAKGVAQGVAQRVAKEVGPGLTQGLLHRIFQGAQGRGKWLEQGLVKELAKRVDQGQGSPGGSPGM